MRVGHAEPVAEFVEQGREIEAAGLKAFLVISIFMGVRYNTPLTKVVVLAGFFWLLIMFVLTLNDYLTRGWLGVAGR